MKSLPIFEIFYSLQGEGANMGKAAYFVRLAGCDVRCGFCDVKEAWDDSKIPLVDIEKILHNIKAHNAQNVVITGGEPMLHNLDDFCASAKKMGLNLWLETSGSSDLSGKWDWVCVSPKKNKPPLLDVLAKANELKVVISSQEDFVWAESLANKVNSNCHLFLQAEWDLREKIYPLIANYILQHPEWRLSVQMHKYLGIA